MREGVEFISQWEKLKGGQWSEDIKVSQLEVDVEIADIASGEAADPGIGMGAPMGDPSPPRLLQTLLPAPDAPHRTSRRRHLKRFPPPKSSTRSTSTSDGAPNGFECEIPK